MSQQNWLVALDESIWAYYAFNFALDTIQKKYDHLYLICVSQDATGMFGALRDVKQLHKNQSTQARRVLGYYYNKATEKKINCTMILGHGRHIGDTICSAVETFKISHVIIGRRTMADVKRLLMGSTSRYVVENATCTVAVVKQPSEGKVTNQRSLDEKFQRISVQSQFKYLVKDEEKELAKLQEGKVDVADKNFHLMYSFNAEKPLARKEVAINKRTTTELEGKELPTAEERRGEFDERREEKREEKREFAPEERRTDKKEEERKKEKREYDERKREKEEKREEVRKREKEREREREREREKDRERERQKKEEKKESKEEKKKGAGLSWKKKDEKRKKDEQEEESPREERGETFLKAGSTKDSKDAKDVKVQTNQPVGVIIE